MRNCELGPSCPSTFSSLTVLSLLSSLLCLCLSVSASLDWLNFLLTLSQSQNSSVSDRIQDGAQQGAQENLKQQTYDFLSFVKLLFSAEGKLMFTHFNKVL